MLVSSVASKIGSMAYKKERTEKEDIVWESENLLDYLYYNDNNFLPYEKRFNRGNVALGYTGVTVSLGVGGTLYISDPAQYGQYDYLGSNSIDGDWNTLIYLASGSF